MPRRRSTWPGSCKVTPTSGRSPNDIAESEAEVQQAEETSAALAESELLAWQAERAVAAADSVVEESQKARGV
jgi:hypothetical protein